MDESDDKFSLSKLQAAERQLNGAIRLLFSGVDPVVVHTLAGAASSLFSDLLKHQSPEDSWHLKGQIANELSEKTYNDIMNKTQNFLKHADRDPDGTMMFDPIETDSILFLTVMNASELGPISPEAKLFQVWYLASRNATGEEESFDDFKEIIKLFGDLRAKPRLEQLSIGAEKLELGLKGKR